MNNNYNKKHQEFIRDLHKKKSRNSNLVLAFDKGYDTTQTEIEKKNLLFLS